MLKLQLKRLLLVATVGAGLLLPAMGTAFAQNDNMMRDKSIHGGTYDHFQVAGSGGARTCAETCLHDPRCKAWTYARDTNDCKLKFDPGQMVDDTCCVSGLKPAEAAQAPGKQAFCSDYATKAVAANSQNVNQECNLTGARWSDDFQTHYSWCMGVHRDEASTEADARGADIAQCLQTVQAGVDAKCDHYVRISMVQIETARKANCALPQDDARWGDNPADRKQACLQAPAHALKHDIPEREAVLQTCLIAAGQARQACKGYVDKAMEQVQAATAQGCDVSGAKWSSARAEHMQFCLGSDANARLTLISERGRQIEQCGQLAAKRRTCDQYGEAAVGQAVRAETDKCDLRGSNWSRYKDEHVAFCMQANDAQLTAANADRETALTQCHQRAQVDPECDQFAKRAERILQLNKDKGCGLDGDNWEGDHAKHYQFCLRSNPIQRRHWLDEQRAGLFLCSITHGFKLELGF
jgi:PAN domain